MSRASSSTRGSWERPEGTCPECSFDWGVSAYEVLVGQCVRNVAVFGGCCRASILPRPWIRGSGRPAATSGTRSMSCGSAPSDCGRSAPIPPSACRIGTRTWWPKSAVTTPSRRSSGSSPSSPRPRPGGPPPSRRRTTSPPRIPRPACVYAFDIVQRNAHEVCHHLWDVQRALPSSNPAEETLGFRHRHRDLAPMEPHRTPVSDAAKDDKAAGSCPTTPRRRGHASSRRPARMA